jgi:cytochrome c oxidase cbb3-type subunit 1
MISIGCIYVLIPRIFRTAKMYSTSLINLHFWLAFTGTIIYITSLWIAGVMQGLMWRAVNSDGTLTYTFNESVAASHPYYVIRLIGGLVFFSGMLIMAYNVWQTIKNSRQAVEGVAA